MGITICNCVRPNGAGPCERCRQIIGSPQWYGFGPQLGVAQGWECPRCKRINAPAVSACPCSLAGALRVRVKPTAVFHDTCDLRPEDCTTYTIVTTANTSDGTRYAY